MSANDPGLPDAVQRVRGAMRGDGMDGITLDEWCEVLARAAREDVADTVREAKEMAWDEATDYAWDQPAGWAKSTDPDENPYRAAAIREGRD